MVGDKDGVEHVRPKSRRRKIGLGVAAVIVAALVGGYFLRPKPEAAPAAEAANETKAQLVTAIVAGPRDFSRTVPVSGEVRPVKDVRVFAPAARVRIEEVLVEVGDTVEEGQPLARLDADVVKAEVTEAEARVRQAASEEVRAVGDWGRIAPVAEDPAFSKEEIAKYRAAAEAAKAQVAAERAALAQVQARMQDGYVRAPAAGLVIERNAHVGEFADQQALFRIVGDNRLEVAAQVSEGDILLLKQGQVATFRAGEGVAVEATLRVAPVAVDPDSRTGEALFDLPADAPVRAGMYLRGEVVVDRNTALAVPTTAVSYASGEPGVFVIEDGKARLRTVALGARTGDYVAVVSGLREGETVAAAGGAFIMDGDPVRTTTPEAAAAAVRASLGG